MSILFESRVEFFQQLFHERTIASGLSANLYSTIRVAAVAKSPTVQIKTGNEPELSVAQECVVP